MQNARQIGEALPPGVADTLPVCHRGCAGCYPGLSLYDVGRVCLGVLMQRLQALLGVFEIPFGVPQTTEDGQRIALGQVMAQVKHVRDAQAAQPRVGQLDQRLGPVTHHVQHLGAKGRQALVGTVEPGVKAASRRHLFQQHIARGQVHAHQHHPLQKRLIHRPNDWSDLTVGNAFFLPHRSRLQDEAFQRVHDGSQGAGGAPHMPLQAETGEKLAEGLGSYPSFEAEHQQGSHDQTDEPGAACWRFPQRRLRVAISAVDGLKLAMHAAFGKPSAIRQAPDTLFAVFTNRVENDNALAPQSHGVGPCSEGWLKSWKKSALQSTRSTTGCPALGAYPGGLMSYGPSLPDMYRRAAY